MVCFIHISPLPMKISMQCLVTQVLPYYEELISTVSKSQHFWAKAERLGCAHTMATITEMAPDVQLNKSLRFSQQKNSVTQIAHVYKKWTTYDRYRKERKGTARLLQRNLALFCARPYNTNVGSQTAWTYPADFHTCSEAFITL